MPQRASRQDVGSSLGKMIFHTTDARRMQHKMRSVGKEALQSALEQRGVKGANVKKLTEALTGGKRANLSQYELRKAVTAMQDVGLARKALSADQMVFRAAKDAQDNLRAHDADFKGLTPEQIRKRMAEMEEQRKREGEKKEEGFAVDQYTDSRGVMDRARSGVTTSNRSDAGADVTSAPIASGDTPGATIRSLRAWQQSMQLQPKMTTRPSTPPPTLPPQFAA